MSMKRYSADSCSVQYFQPYQQYKYVPGCLPECLPEYENWSQCAPAVKTYLFPCDMPNPFFEAMQKQSYFLHIDTFVIQQSPLSICY
jgi:hypothetical protein